MLLNTNYYWVNQIPTKMNHVMDITKLDRKPTFITYKNSKENS